MDPIVLPELIGRLGTQAARKLGETWLSSARIRRIDALYSAAEDATQDASVHLLETTSRLSEVLGVNDASGVSRYLQTPAADALARSIMTSNVLDEYGDSKSAFVARVQASLFLVHDVSPDGATAAARELVTLLADVSERAAAKFRADNPTEFRQLKQTALSQQEVRYLRSIETTLRASEGIEADSLPAIYRFVREY